MFNRRLILLVLGSFITCAILVMLRIGIGATPYETTDSLGRAMGFNDRLYPDHYFIMLANFEWAALWKVEHAYEWLLAAVHLIGAGLLLMSGRISTRPVRWFFAAQLFLFPIGVLAVLYLPSFVYSVLTAGMDREGFVDLPFIVLTTHPIWLFTSLYITFALRGEGLGLNKIWDGLVRMKREAAIKLVSALR